VNAGQRPAPGYADNSGRYGEPSANAREKPANERVRPADPAGETQAARQRRELILYLLAGAAALEFMSASGALLYAFVNGYTGPDGRFVFSFPLIPFSAAALLIPALLLLFVHLADVGLFRERNRASATATDSAGTLRAGGEGAGGQAAADAEAWEALLPERPARLFRILRGVPAVALLVGIILLGAALLTLDSVLDALGRLASVFAPHAEMLLVCLSVLVCFAVAGVLLLRYRTRKMQEEYAFRREVLEKTGVIIVEKGSRALPPGGIEVVPQILPALESERPALPPAPEDVKAEL
jgi:hypothetical protein